MTLFTIDEANRLLPVLRPLLETLRDSVSRLLELPEAQGGEKWARRNGHSRPDAADDRAARAREELAQQVAAIQELGCELKDPRTGLIDFPHLRDGRVVLLCWMLDEAEVQFWHPIETGFAGRQPL